MNKPLYTNLNFEDVILEEVTKIVQQIKDDTLDVTGDSAADINVVTEGFKSQRIHISRFLESSTSSITINIDVILGKIVDPLSMLFPNFKDN